MTPNSIKVQFYEAGPLKSDLEERVGGGLTSSHSGVAKRDLERYYEMLKRSLPTFTLGEAVLLVDVMNGHIVMPYSVSLLWAEVSDALPDGYAEKWGVDGPALVERLRKLTPFECMAVADAVERAWNSASYQVTNMEEKVRKVGLVRES